MPDGSRTQTGCLTCRIRKKKCDEQRPVCQSCRSRRLACYGYNEPAPNWYAGKAHCNEAKNSDEAKHLRTLAETRYKIRRKVALKEDISTSTTKTSTPGLEDKDNGNLRHQQQQLQPSSGVIAHNMFPSSNVVLGGMNIWQLRPDTIWWDSRIRNLAPDSDTSNEKTRLLTLFLEVIHPITHTFYKLDHDKDRSWMLNRLISSRPLYDSALSISACFDNSLTRPPTIDNIGICPQVIRLQGMAVRGLKSEVDKFVLMESTPLEDFIWTAMQLLNVIANLQTLEIFSMLQGYWEMHHRAARKILNHVEICVSSHRCNAKWKASVVETALSLWPRGHERRRSLEFCITNFIWIDVLAIATFGVHSYDPCAFDYVSLLQSEQIKPQNVMGCQGWIMAKIVEIANLERRKETHPNQTHTSDDGRIMLQRDQKIAEELQCGVDQLERDYNRHGATALEEDSRLISILWAYGAQILRQTRIFDLEPNHTTTIDQTFVNICLEKLEEMPTRLIMRATWPYTIAGCMSKSQYQHERFRRVFGKTMREAQPPGISWKGLVVMEECWRLRQLEGHCRRIGWREAMERLGARVVLT